MLFPHIGVTFKLDLEVVKNLNRIFWWIDYLYEAIKSQIWPENTKSFFSENEAIIETSQKCSSHVGVTFKRRWTFCSLLFARYFLLVARCSLLFARCFLLFACYFLLVARYFLLVAFCSLLLTFCLLLFARYLLLFASCFLLVAPYFLLVALYFFLQSSVK